LTGQDGLNGKDLTSKVNALRNGEAGTVVYTDENGNRLAKANDGNYYPATAVDKDGNVLNNTPAATTVQARLVNPDGTTTGGTTKLSNIADGEIASGSHDAVTGGQLFSKLAEKADKSVVDSLTTKVNTNTTDIAGLKTTVDKAITFKGDDNQDVERKLDTTLTVKGAENFTPADTNPATEAGVNIRVEKDPTTNANGLVVKLADTLTNIKGISGNGTNDLVIKNGDNAVITVKPGAAGTKGDVDFGGSKLTNVGAPGVGTDVANKDYVDTKVGEAAATGNAKLGYKANAETDVKQVAVGTGLHFKSGTGTVGATGADAATTNAAVDAAKTEGAKAVENVTPVVKEAAKKAIADELAEKEKAIDARPDLTDEEKAAAKKEAQDKAKKATDAIKAQPDNATTPEAAKAAQDAVDAAKKSGVDEVKAVDPVAAKKPEAKKAVDAALKAKEDAIDAREDLTPAEKDEAKKAAKKAAEDAKKAIVAAPSHASVAKLRRSRGSYATSIPAWPAPAGDSRRSRSHRAAPLGLVRRRHRVRVESAP